MSDLGSDEGNAAEVPEGVDGGTSSPGWPRRWRPWQVVVALAAVAALVAGVLVATRGPSAKQRVSTVLNATSTVPRTTTASATTTASTTTTPSSAASDLAPFFAAAAHEDTKLKAAAALVNGDVGKTQVTFDQATVDAVRSLDPKAVADTIPNGLEPGMKRDVLLVYSDIMSRTMAMSRPMPSARTRSAITRPRTSSPASTTDRSRRPATRATSPPPRGWRPNRRRWSPSLPTHGPRKTSRSGSPKST